MDTTEFVLTYLGGLISGVIIIVGGEMLNRWLNRLKMNVTILNQIIVNTPTKHSEVLGFGITIEQGKEPKDAYAKYNGVDYPWWKNGKQEKTKTLFVGEEPSWVVPYLISLEYVEDASKQTNIQSIRKGDPSNHAILFTIFELDPEKNTPKNKLFERIIIMPKNAKETNISINQLLAKMDFRLIGKGIEKKMKYTGEIKIKGLSIGKIENGVAFLDTCIVNLVIYHD